MTHSNNNCKFNTYQQFIDELEDDIITNQKATYEKYDIIAIHKELLKRIKFWKDKQDALFKYKTEDYIKINRGFA